MKELTKSEEQMMDIFWDSKEALTSVDIVKMQVKATWTNGLVHNIIRSLVQDMEQVIEELEEIIRKLKEEQ